MRGLSASAAAVVIATATACGGGPGRGTASTTASAPAPVALAITRPAGGSVAAVDRSGTLRAAVAVSGRAAPYATISVRADCRAAGCQGGADVDASGHWHTSLRVQADPARPQVRITAEIGGEVAVASVRLRGPRAAASTPPRARPARRPAAPTSTAPRPATSTAAAPSSLLLVGDSLGVGTAPALAGLLPGWQVSAQVREDRTLAQGMSRWAARSATPLVAAFSLFTNDDPRALGALRAAVLETVADAGAGCAIWATILRPPVGGVSYAAANRLLAGLAADDPRHLIIVDWAAAAAAHPAWLAPDGVHGTASGYAARAQLYAQAARDCPAA